MPILEDLGIDFEEIFGNFKSVLLFRQFEEKWVRNLDLLGPLFIAFSTALILTLVLNSLIQRGKFIFSYIYGFGSFGSFLVYFIINLVIKNKYFSLYDTLSGLGYSLMPIAFLSFFSLLLNLKYGPLIKQFIGDDSKHCCCLLGRNYSHQADKYSIIG